MILPSMTILPNSINISAHPIYVNTLVNVLHLLIPVSHLKVKFKSLNKSIEEKEEKYFLKDNSENKHYPEAQPRPRQVPL